jgi:hypothetical protein
MPAVRSLVFSSQRALAPGRYRRDGFVPSLSFEVGEGWYAVQDVPGFFDVERDPGAPDVIAVQFARPSGVEARGTLIEALRGRTDLVATPAEEVAIGGERGVSVRVDAADPDLARNAFVPVFSVDAGPISIASGRRLELIQLDRPDGLLVVLVGGSVRGWQGARDAAGPVLASIRFDAPEEGVP